MIYPLAKGSFPLVQQSGGGGGGNYVPLSRKIAGLSLESDITAQELNQALGASNYVPLSRTIAGLSLGNDITAQAMTDALVYATSQDIDEMFE